nr:hypothetical protein [Pedobacter sp. ok626]
MKRYPLCEKPAKNIEKRLKPDFEALAFYANSFHLFGSGSTENRTKMVQLNEDTKEIVSVLDLSALYKRMQDLSGLNNQTFNIEGVVHTGDSLYFFNRGNGNFGKNIVFTLHGKHLTGNSKITFTELKLPEIRGVCSSFTDAIKVEDKF